jgi:hypothetical protein
MSHLGPWLATALVVNLIATAVSPHPDPELGLVRWGRDLDAALAGSRSTGRPVLVLFDEVPGCATCRGFGAEVLSHPLIADAIESEFVPLFVANCRPGRDAEWLARFGEPAWNNPVVRFLDARGHDVIARADELYSPHEIAARLAEALRAAGRPVPGYLALAIEETQTAHRREATFGMFCFWEGEARLGSLPGVLDVRAVHTGGGEGVRVTYDESRLSYPALVRAAGEQRCAVRAGDGGAAEREAAGDDHLHALAASPLRWLPLTPMQAMRVNAALAAGRDGLEFLSPRQRELARRTSALSPGAARRLAGLARPDDVDALAAYERRLRVALGE